MTKAFIWHQKVKIANLQLSNVMLKDRVFGQRPTPLPLFPTEDPFSADALLILTVLSYAGNHRLQSEVFGPVQSFSPPAVPCQLKHSNFGGVWDINVLGL